MRKTISADRAVVSQGPSLTRAHIRMEYACGPRAGTCHAALRSSPVRGWQAWKHAVLSRRDVVRADRNSDCVSDGRFVCVTNECLSRVKICAGLRINLAGALPRHVGLCTLERRPHNCDARVNWPEIFHIWQSSLFRPGAVIGSARRAFIAALLSATGFLVVLNLFSRWLGSRHVRGRKAHRMRPVKMTRMSVR